MLHRKFSFALLIGFYCCFVHAINADTIVHGDFEGNDLFFKNVNESANEDIFPLFGAPTVQGNSLLFENPGFSASVGENSLDFIDGRLSVEISSKNNEEIYGFELSELGSFITSGDDMDVFVSGIAFAIAGNDIYDAYFQYWNNSETSGDWNGSLVVQFREPVTSFDFVMDNQLFARAGVGSTAAINKELIKLSIRVPEPATAVFFFGTAALAGICFSRRRSLV